MNSKTEIADCEKCGIPFEREISRFKLLIPKHCDACSDKILKAENEEQALIDQERDDKIRRTRRENLIPPIYREFDKSKLPTEEGRTLTEELSRYEIGPRGVGLTGETRLGKTFIMFNLLGRFTESGVRVKACNGVEFASMIADLDERKSFIADCCRSDVLFIDDLAKAKMTERVESDIWHILESRKNHFLPVFATLNCNSNHLTAMFSPEMARPIVERLREICEFKRIK